MRTEDRVICAGLSCLAFLGVFVLIFIINCGLAWFTQLVLAGFGVEVAFWPLVGAYYLFGVIAAMLRGRSG